MATSTAPTPAGESPQVRPERPRFHSGETFFWGIMLILSVGFLAWLTIGYFGTDNFQDYDQQRVKGRLDILQKRNSEDAKLLNDPPSYLDRDKGKIRVPLTEAMKLALPALQADKPHPAYPLTQSPPQPAAAPTSPDKGAGSPKDGSINPSASNPTVNQPSPAPAAAPSPTPVPPAAAATPVVGTTATGTPAPPEAAGSTPPPDPKEPGATPGGTP